MSELADWVDGAAAPSLLVVKGGSHGDFLDAAAQPTRSAKRLLCGRDTAAEAAERGAAMGLAPPPPVISKGFGRDLPALLNATKPVVTLVPAALLDANVVDRTAGAQSEIELLCSYRMPAAVVSRAVCAGFARAFAEIAAKGRCPVAVHDPRDALGLAEGRGVAVVRLSGEPDPAPDALLDEGETPSLTAITRHAEFLVGTEADELVRLHRLYAPKAMEPVRDYWVRALVHGAAEGLDRDLAADALLALLSLSAAR